MKNLKKIFTSFIIIFIIVFSNLYSQDISQGEFMIINNTGQSGGHYIIVKMYPSGAVFNGDYYYTLDAKYSIPNHDPYIYGVNNLTISNDHQSSIYYRIANFDKTSDIQDCIFSLGYGLYKIEIYDVPNGSIINWCYVDFSDANYCVNIPNNNYLHRLIIDVGENDVLHFYYLDNNGNPTNSVSLDHQTAKVWEQKGTINEQNPPIQSKGDFTDFENDQSPEYKYHDFPIDAHRLFGMNVYHEHPDEVNLNLRLHYREANLLSDYTLKFKECTFTIDDNWTFTINSGYYNNLMIYGLGAKFKTGNNAKLFFPENYQLKILDNATIESNGTQFQIGENLPIWDGIYLENCGGAFFQDCEFNYAKNSIYSTNCGVNFHNINHNTFTIPITYDEYNPNHGINIWKSHNIYIYNNNFNFPSDPCASTAGIGIYQNANSEEENNDAYWISMNIVNNYFYGGNYQLVVDALSDQYFSPYIKDNHFYDGLFNIGLLYTYGRIIHNEIVNTNENQCNESLLGNIQLSKNNSDFYNNNILGNYDNYFLYVSCYPNLAPYILPNGTVLWKGGKNIIHSTAGRNFWGPTSDYPGNIYSNYGKNTFIVANSTIPHFNLYLNMSCSEIYKTICNYWYGNNGLPNLILKADAAGGNFCDIEFEGNNQNCEFDEQIIDRLITDMGNGIFDTVLITSTYNPPPSEDVALYGTAFQNQTLKNYSTAISGFKNLITNYPNSKYLEKTIYNLYECYTLCDTNHNQGWRNVIFNDLKNYLEAKIQQYDTNETFISLAFDFLLKCKIKLKFYQPAMDGYAFIAENSPSPTERLIASINYIDVEGLLQGSGSGQNDDPDLANELNSSQTGKPIKDILLAAYNKTKEIQARRENLDLKNSNDVSRTRAEQDNRHRQDKVLENRALENINISSSLTKEERRTRIQKDLRLFTSRNDNTKTFVKKNNVEPVKYELSQNYPNPFNPITNIKYQIQKSGIVTLKIYDITGREIKTLVNEIKNPGSYIVTFNGTEFASGVYFYRIQSGDFVQVKKMVLIK
jgi:hypothetical protein